MTVYVYEGHLGGNYYLSDEDIPYDDLYCEECGDCDMFIGSAESAWELWEILCQRIYPFNGFESLADMIREICGWSQEFKEDLSELDNLASLGYPNDVIIALRWFYEKCGQPFMVVAVISKWLDDRVSFYHVGEYLPESDEEVVEVSEEELPEKLIELRKYFED